MSLLSIGGLFVILGGVVALIFYLFEAVVAVTLVTSNHFREKPTKEDLARELRVAEEYLSVYQGKPVSSFYLDWISDLNGEPRRSYILVGIDYEERQFILDTGLKIKFNQL